MVYLRDLIIDLLVPISSNKEAIKLLHKTSLKLEELVHNCVKSRNKDTINKIEKIVQNVVLKS